jgi:hypothetical protein
MPPHLRFEYILNIARWVVLILPLAAMIMENVDKKRGMLVSYAPQVLVKIDIQFNGTLI